MAAPTPDIPQLVVSFIGGGAASAAINWFHANRVAHREQEASFLSNQLAQLYGPLHFFASQNEQLFKLSDDVQQQYTEHFTGRWSEQAAIQQSLDEAMMATIALSNSYIERVVENNARVSELLATNWHLVDPDDIEVFSRFQVHYTRYLHEVKQAGRAKIPFTIVMRLGPIPFMASEMIERVRSTFEKQQRRLQKLR
jgi:hypothetical protein